MMIPMPPSHWVRARQKRIPFGSTLGSPRIDDPVVVNPDAVSKNASVRSGMAPLNR